MDDLKRNVRGLLEQVFATPGDHAVRLILADALSDFTEGRADLKLENLRSEDGYWSFFVNPTKIGQLAVPQYVLQWCPRPQPSGDPYDNRVVVCTTWVQRASCCECDVYSMLYYATEQTDWQWKCPNCIGGKALRQNGELIVVDEVITE